jgi:hypothetical protein
MPNQLHLKYKRDSNGKYMGGFTFPIAVRFNNKYIVDSITGCWVWNDRLTNKGYGKIYSGLCKKELLAHRVSWVLANNSIIPNGIKVLHKCDNPACVNPNHLFLGTQKDNVLDMLAKHRQNKVNTASGENNGNSKLKNSDVLIIKRRLKNGDKPTHIAKEYKMHHSTIMDIRDGKTWTKIGG